MPKILKTINKYRTEIVYSIIAFSGLAILFFQYQSTQNFAWFISLTLFCSKMAIGIINYEQYCQSNKRSMKIALKYLLFKFV
ncbi:Orphan protein [Pseudoalteromonas atlantica]